ncbi:MAG: FtsX-like permease family protein, partial [Gemmatimonadaceae bacterium]
EARGVDAGFNARNVLTFRVQPPDDSAFSGERAIRYKEEMLTRLAALPGAEGAAINYCAPLSQACNLTITFGIDGVRGFSGGEAPEIGIHSVNPDYLKVIGAKLEKGRFISNADRLGAPKVVVINSAAAKRLFPGQDAIGHRISLAIGLFKDNDYGEIVGVVNDVNYNAVGDAPTPAAYTSYLQTTNARGLYMVRTTGNPEALIPAVRETLRSINANLPLYDAMSLEARVGQALGRLRFGAVLLGSFAILGLVLTMVGIYGVLSYSVAQRTRELGIRLALGAARGALVSMVMRRAMALASLGVVAGLAAAWGSSRFLRGLVFGITPTDPLTFFGIAVVVTAVCAVASYLPARKAARLDPVRALRTD